MQIKRGTAIIPIEDLLFINASKLDGFIGSIWDCLEAIVTDPIHVVIGCNGKRVSIVLGIGSLIVNSDCSKFIEEAFKDFRVYKLIKDEWVDACRLENRVYFNVAEDRSHNIDEVRDVRIVSLTQKMIYPRVFNGWRIERASPLVAGAYDEWVITDEKLESPIVLFTEDNNILVASGSEELELLKTFLRLESHCSKYRLIAS